MNGEHEIVNMTNGTYGAITNGY